MGKLIRTLFLLAMGYSICYYDWLPEIVGWVENIFNFLKNL